MATQQETSAEALRWLVRSRNNIQELLLRLDHHRNLPDGRHWQLYIGAAFSLWRAVFLCHDATQLKRKLEPDARAFLRKVIERNTIGFSDDVAARAWTGGYYINNALFRLGMATFARPSHKSQRALWDDAFNKLDGLIQQMPTEP